MVLLLVVEEKTRPSRSGRTDLFTDRMNVSLQYLVSILMIITTCMDPHPCSSDETSSSISASLQYSGHSDQSTAYRCMLPTPASNVILTTSKAHICVNVSNLQISAMQYFWLESPHLLQWARLEYDLHSILVVTVFYDMDGPVMLSLLRVHNLMNHHVYHAAFATEPHRPVSADISIRLSLNGQVLLRIKIYQTYSKIWHQSWMKRTMSKLYVRRLDHSVSSGRSKIYGMPMLLLSFFERTARCLCL